jgi:uncharacterized repeat protein (TIGR04076 family)
MKDFDTRKMMESDTKFHDIEITIKEVKGYCPTYKVGDKIFLNEGFRLNISKTTALCIPGLASIMPWAVAMANGISPIDVGLNKKTGDGKTGYVQCADPGTIYTDGGTVVFEIKVLDSISSESRVSR